MCPEVGLCLCTSCYVLHISQFSEALRWPMRILQKCCLQCSEYYAYCIVQELRTTLFALCVVLELCRAAADAAEKSVVLVDLLFMPFFSVGHEWVQICQLAIFSFIKFELRKSICNTHLHFSRHHPTSSISLFCSATRCFLVYRSVLKIAFKGTALYELIKYCWSTFLN